MLFSFLHELLGHGLAIIQQYLYDKNIMSPKTKGKNFTNYANIRGRESEEFILVKLFDEKITTLMYHQILYIFNINNYNLNYNEFKHNFKSYNQTEIPDILKDLLDENYFTPFSAIDLESYDFIGEEHFCISLLEDIENICNPNLLDNKRY